MPTSRTLWKCSLCSTEYDTEVEAVTCEVKGLPEQPSWLFEGAQVWGFGENGIVGPGTVAGLHLRARHNSAHSGHVWAVELKNENEGKLIGAWQLSHNHGDDGRPGPSLVPASALDPMKGWDFLRYCTIDVDTWIAVCRAYAIDPTKVAGAYWAEGRSDAWIAVLKRLEETS